MAPLRTLLLGALSLLTSIQPAVVSGQNNSIEGWPVHNDGLNSVVQWDHYSIIVNGRRLFVFAGEWHYWRLPVPEMWVDILQKIKSAGFTGFTFYSNWGYHAPNSTTLDFTNGAHNFTTLYTIAKDLGLYVLIRPGPYVNAEANAGGFPLWLTTGAYGTLRNNDSRYTDAWTPYFDEHASISSEYLVTKGENGLVYQIENEIGGQWKGSPTNRVPNPTATAYMELLEAAARRNGIDVPLTQNQPNMNSYSWSSDWAPGAGGNVDIDGVDSYPSCWTCDLSQCASTNGPYVPYQVVDYYNYFETFQPTQPRFLPEFQGGSFNPWGGPEGGCPSDIGADFANLFYRHNIGEGVTAMSLYMLYGGTNWGSLAAPVVATSYDYAAPVSEDRSIGSKFYETKLLALFTRVAHDLTATDRIANTNNASISTNPNVLVTELRNPVTNGAFYVTIHNTSSSGTLEQFQLHVNTSEGLLTIPQKGGNIALNGHQSKIICTDFSFGSEKLIYSTAEVLSYAILDGVPTLALWVPDGEDVEFSVANGHGAQISRCQGCSNVNISKGNSSVTVALTQGTGMSVIMLQNGVRVLTLSRTFAYQTWVPTLTNDPFAPENETIIVQGPYLVRGATLVDSTVAITGDLSGPTMLEVFIPRAVKHVTWNGQVVAIQKTQYGSLTAQLSGLNQTITLPPLTDWKYKGSLEEHKQNYNDNGPAWVVANHTTTPNPTKPASLPVLYVDDYGFHNGVHLFRGYFSGLASAVFLNIQGGTAFGYSVYLNGDHIGSFYGRAALEAGNGTFSFKNATYHAPSSGKENVLFVIQDNTGHDETTGALDPRGIMQATLLTPDNSTLNFTTWKIAGTAGGDANPIDPVRGALAEGGLRAERLGWHLPGFDDKSWANANVATAANDSAVLSFKGAGVRFYRTVVPLNVPSGVDVSIAFNLAAPGPQTMRVQLFVNGYQYGRFNPWIGHQTVFPVPPGILDYTGDNTIGVAIWAQSKEGAQLDIDWSVQYAVTSSFDNNFNGTYLRPGWTPERRQWA